MTVDGDFGIQSLDPLVPGLSYRRSNLAFAKKGDTLLPLVLIARREYGEDCDFKFVNREKKKNLS